MLRKCSAIWLQFIGFALSLILIVSGIGYFVTVRDYKRFKMEAEQLREEYIAGQRRQIKEQVEQVVDFIQYNCANAEERLRNSVKQRTYEAFAIATSLWQANVGRVSEQELRNIITSALRPIRFNHNRGYFFATGLDGVEILFADRPELEGQSMLETRDTRGRYVIRDMIELVRKDGEGYYQYTWTKPNAQGKDFRKIAFLKHFAPLNCFIGTGEYLDDVEEDIRKEVLDRIGKIRFGKEGYIFVVGFDGVTLMNGAQPEFIGKDISELADPKGVKVFKEERRAAENADGDFIQYEWQKPSTKGIRTKISFVKAFTPWEWIVGAGIYTDEIEPAISAMGASAKREMLKDLYRLCLSLAVLLVAGLSIWFPISRYFKGQLDLFMHFFKEAAAGGKPIDTERIFSNELKLFAESANRMLQERQRAEESLKESEELYRSLVSLSPDSIAMADLNGCLVFRSPKATQLFGYSPDDNLIGYNLLTWVAPEDHEKASANIRHLLTEGTLIDSEYMMLRKDGTCFTGEVNAAVIRAPDGSPMKMIMITRDITERKRAEDVLKRAAEELRLSERRLRRAEVAARFGNWEFILRENRVTASEGAKIIYGVEGGEWTIPAVQEIALPEYRSMLDLALSGLVKEGKPYDVEFKIRRPVDGKIIDIHSIAEYSHENEVVFGVIQDITERNRAEEEKRKLEERLQRAEKMEALGTMAGGVAHDLNNVLGIIVGYSELILVRGEVSGSAESHVRDVLKAGQRAATIVEDLLTLTRRGVLSRQVLNLNNIIMECQESPEFAKLLSYHPNVHVRTDLEADVLNMSGSSVHVEKTLMNLISNAAEAMPNGGEITIRTRSRYLDKPVSGYDEVKEGDYVVLSISDTGEGIPADDLKRIFEPFYTKKVMGRSGTGLGLAVVWGTVKDHHGYINVESNEGKGTTFTLYFPVTREELSPEEVSVSASAYMGNGESILVVDDVKEQRELACAMLKKLNYTVVTVSSGEEAVEYMQDHEVDLVVLDMIMDPGMDGLDTYRKILGLHPHQKAVIVSGYAETERVKKAQSLGAGAYVKKPYVLEKLGLAVKKELGRLA
jgi:PAS domain S-box-containing protein